MSSRPATPPARAAYQPRPEARSHVGSNSWTAILEYPSDQCYGSLRKPKAQVDPNVTHISVSCDMPNINSKGLAFPTSLTLRFKVPYLSTTEPGQLDTHLVTVKIFIQGLHTMIVNHADFDLPEYIIEMPEFVACRTPLTQLRLVTYPKGIICDGLFITPPFADPVALQMLGVLKRMFGSDGQFFNVYVLSERNNLFTLPISRLIERQLMDKDSNIYEKFYSEVNDRFIPASDMMRSGENRPCVSYEPDLPVSLNKLEMVTKYAMGVLQLKEFQQASAVEFNEAIFEMKVFTFNSANSKMYFALLKSKTAITLTPRDGQKLQIQFNQDGMPSNEKWRAKVVAPLKHYLSNYICINLYRPRQAHPPDAIEYTRVNEVLGFVETALGSGEIEELDNEDIVQNIIDNTETFQVKALVKLSETTTDRQMVAIEALQRGARFNIKKKPHELTYHPWTASKEVEEWAEFLQMRNSVPKSRRDWLGPAGMAYVRHLTDPDQLDAINNLFRSAPSPVGVLVGPAGTGKTVLMATMINAHVSAHGSKHVVGSPSNVGAIVAAQKIGALFKANPKLRGKIVMRAYHDGPEESQLPGGSDGSQSPTQSSQADADVGVYSADGWFNTADSQTKNAMKDMMTVIRKNAEIEDVDDPRRESFNQSLAYHALCVLGFDGFAPNDFTAGYQEMAGDMINYLKIALQSGVDSLNAAQIRFCQQEKDRLFAYTIRNSSVVVGTLTYLGHPLFAQEFRYIDTYWTDEAGMASIPDWMNGIARYHFKQAFILGDHNQLHPVVVGPSPLNGFMRCLEMSPIQLLMNVHWSAVTLTLNRRSAAGIIDIPSDLFYKGLVKAHPTSRDEGKHKWTAPVAKLIRDAFAPNSDEFSLSSVAYFSSNAPSGVDRLTFSTYNTKNMAFCLNFIEKCVMELKIPAEKIGYASPYQAQCKRVAYALRKMESRYKVAFSLVKCAPIDSFQGSSASVMIGDFTSSEKLGFMTARGRNNVLLTRAEDYALYIGNKEIRAPRDETKNYHAMAFAMAGVSKVRYDLDVEHEWMKHPFA